MNCKHIHRYTDAYLDHELHEQQRKQVEAHVETCTSCQLAKQQAEQLLLAIGRLPEVHPPYSIVDKIMPALHDARIEKQQLFEKQQQLPSLTARLQSLIRHRLAWRIATGASVACIAIVLVFQQFPLASPTSKEMIEPPAMLQTSAVSQNSNHNKEQTETSKKAHADKNLDSSTTYQPNDVASPDTTNHTYQYDITSQAGKLAAMASPDGHYLAILRNQHVEILDAKTQEVVYTSKYEASNKDLITIVEWTKEGKLIYEVVSGETGETLNTYQIDIAQATEDLIPSYQTD